MRQFRVLAAMAGVATTGILAWSVTVGAAGASGAARLRSGTLHAQLVSHVAPTSSSLLTGSDIMADIVGSLAVVAFAFVIVTLVRRRVTAPPPRPIA